MAYVSGNAWIERSFADGMRKCIAEEFSKIYIVDLRGDIRKNMLSKGVAKEGGNIFDSRSMSGITITFLVKNMKSSEAGEIYYHDIGDDLKSIEKRVLLNRLKSIKGITSFSGWTNITLDKHYDWVDQREEGSEEHIKMGDKKISYLRQFFEPIRLAWKQIFPR